MVLDRVRRGEATGTLELWLYDSVQTAAEIVHYRVCISNGQSKQLAFCSNFQVRCTDTEHRTTADELLDFNRFRCHLLSSVSFLDSPWSCWPLGLWSCGNVGNALLPNLSSAPLSCMSRVHVYR